MAMGPAATEKVDTNNGQKDYQSNKLSREKSNQREIITTIIIKTMDVDNTAAYQSAAASSFDEEEFFHLGEVAADEAEGGASHGHGNGLDPSSLPSSSPLPSCNDHHHDGASIEPTRRRPSLLFALPLLVMAIAIILGFSSNTTTNRKASLEESSDTAATYEPHDHGEQQPMMTTIDWENVMTCPDDTVKFSILYNSQSHEEDGATAASAAAHHHHRSHLPWDPSTVSSADDEKEEEGEGEYYYYTWALLDACTKEVISECSQPCPSTTVIDHRLDDAHDNEQVKNVLLQQQHPQHQVVVVQKPEHAQESTSSESSSINEEATTTDVKEEEAATSTSENNDAQNGQHHDKEWITSDLCIAPDKEYVLEVIRHIILPSSDDDAGTTAPSSSSSSSCCGFSSNTVSSFFVAKYGNVVVATMEDGILTTTGTATATEEEAKDITTQAEAIDVDDHHSSEIKRRKDDTPYNWTELASSSSSCTQLHRKQCGTKVGCYYDMAARTCRSSSSTSQLKKWSIPFGGSEQATPCAFLEDTMPLTSSWMPTTVKSIPLEDYLDSSTTNNNVTQDLTRFPPPTQSPTISPTKEPSRSPSTSPTKDPSQPPTTSPTKDPSQNQPSTTSPTKNSSQLPTTSPTKDPTSPPTTSPTKDPSQPPTTSPNKDPDGLPPENFPLQVCSGDCDQDSDCDWGFKCFQRDALEPVPGCTELGSVSGMDYCFDESQLIEVSCPPPGLTSAVSLTPGTNFKFAPSSPSTFCGIFIQKGINEYGNTKPSLIPFARSYNGNEWEASPGPFASPSSSIHCSFLTGGSGEGEEGGCIVLLPPLSNPSLDSYIILSKDDSKHMMDTEKQIARFLEMTTFGPTREGIDTFLTKYGPEWGAEARARYVREQMDMDATSMREYYRKRVNPKWYPASSSVTTWRGKRVADVGHPCSPNSLWRRYAFIKQDMHTAKDDGYWLYYTFETIDNDDDGPVIYEADSMDDVSNCGECRFRSKNSGYSGVGYYDMDNKGDFVEWTLNGMSAGMYPISFRYEVGWKEYGSRPLDLYVNGELHTKRYEFNYTDYDRWVYSEVIDVALNDGDNTIMFKLEDQSKGPHLDHLRFGKPRAVLVKDSNGQARTVLKDGVGLLKEWTRYDDKGSSTTVWFTEYPEPPEGGYYQARYGKLEVAKEGDDDGEALDIGNPPVYFTGYEAYLPEHYFEFTAQDAFVETGSQLYEYPIQAGNEFLLPNGLDDPICDHVGQTDAPVFGRLPDGSWLQWTPQILLEDNGPSINTKPADMTKHTLTDGGGSLSALRCANVPRSPFNEDTCILSTSPSACVPAMAQVDTENLQIELTPSNIKAMNDIERDNYVYAIKGLGLDLEQHHPCLNAESRWTVEPKEACSNPADGLAINTISALEDTFLASTDTNSYIKDVTRTANCDSGDITKETLGIQIIVGETCYTHVHPHHHNVYDFSKWKKEHPGGKFNIEKWASGWAGSEGWHLDYPLNGRERSDADMNVPAHSMEFWDANEGTTYIDYIARLGDTTPFKDLDWNLRTTEIAKHFGLKEYDPPEGGTVICGSHGEVSNNPALNEMFDIDGDAELLIEEDELNNQKQVVWAEVNLSAEDQLRQRMAWALSQIITVVPKDISNSHLNEKFLSFYDILTKNAYGNYLDILREISYSPIMAEQLSYRESKSHAYIYATQNKQVSRADENFSREIMQLFTIGVIHLNSDGTPIVDVTGEPLQTYTNEDIESLARAWAGFEEYSSRGNAENGAKGLDPMHIVPDWRDAFPKSKLEDSGFIGDKYVLCEDLPQKSFLQKGALYKLLGGTPIPQLNRDPVSFANGDDDTILRAELDPSSQLFEALHNGGSYKLTVELDSDLVCAGIECHVDKLRVVKVGSVYYEYVERPCVQMAWFNNGKMVQLGYDSGGPSHQFCANPNLAQAHEGCCLQDAEEEVQNAIMESGITYLYEGERMTWATAKDRCVNYEKDLCAFETVSASPNDDDFRKGYHWTDQDCKLFVKVNSDGYVAIVHDVDQPPYHVDRSETLNWFRVSWSGEGDYPGSSETNDCSANSCQTLSDGSCLCDIEVVESMVFVDITSASKADVLSHLFVAAPGPPDGSVPSNVGEFTAHILGGTVNETTVFEVEYQGGTLYLKNTVSSVIVKGGNTQLIFEAEEAFVQNATVRNELGSITFVDFDNGESSIEWTVNVENENGGDYALSFQYSLDESTDSRLSILVNGIEVKRGAKNPTIDVTNIPGTKSGSPPAGTYPLQRCQGDCDSAKDQCADGLFCVKRSEGDTTTEVPGCNMDNAEDDWDYCADADDYTHAAVFEPTDTWTYSETIEVTLLAGENTIRAQVPPGQGSGPNIDHMKLKVGAQATDTALSGPSFRNPPHFLSLISDIEHAGLGEQTLRDAQYETDAVLKHYFYHQNVAPFLCTRIMQRFGYSNPSPRYVSVCTSAFRVGSYSSGEMSFGSGQYGSLEAMLAAIILDREATDFTLTSDPSHGSAREPIIKVLSMMRSMEFKVEIPDSDPPMSKDFQVRLWEINNKIGQGPFEFPSIFSFFMADYISDGATVAARLVSPEAILITTPNIIQFHNGMFSMINYGLSDCDGGFSSDLELSSSCSDSGLYERSYGKLSYEPGDGTVAKEAKDLALLLTAGRLKDDKLDLIVNACASQSSKPSRIRCMQQLIITTGEFHSTNLVTQSDEDRDSDTESNVSTKPYKALVYLYLEGGADSFNLLAPYSCTNDVYEKYRIIRGKNGDDEGVGLPLDHLLEIPANNADQPCSSFGIHKDLPVLKDLYENTVFISNAGLLARPVNAKNYSSTSVKLFSHSDMTLETKKDDIADKYDGTGVCGRLADALTSAGMSANTFSIDGQQILLSGESGGTTPYIISSKGLSGLIADDNMRGVILALNNSTSLDSGFFAETYSSKLTDAITKYTALREEVEKAEAMTSTEFPDSDLADQLKIVTQIMQTAQARGAERDIFYVAQDGYDTHPDINTRLPKLFSTMNEALEAFVKELKALNLWESTTLVQFSEFGRTLSPNTGGGTDHGWGGNHFMLGGSVKGGIVRGRYPNDFEQSSSNDFALSRGRMVPEFPFDAMWKGTVEWMGVLSSDMDKVLPMHQHFPPELLYDEDDLFMN